MFAVRWNPVSLPNAPTSTRVEISMKQWTTRRT